MLMGRLTLESIAELAGVSRSTVSRVVNNQSGVRTEVRERVLSVIDQTGYRPDPAARSLAGQRANIIGLVIAEPAQSLFADPYFPRLIQGITQASNARDLTLSLFLFHTKEEEAQLYPKIMGGRLFDGLIVTGTHMEDPLIPDLVENEVPFVLVGYHNNPKVNFIDADNITGAHTAVTHLIRLGYKRIGHITGDLSNYGACGRKEGYINALRDRGRPVEEDIIIEADYTEAGGYDAMVKLIAQNVDAVFIASDSMAQGAIRALNAHHIQIPEQVAIVSFDDLPPASRTVPTLTTIRQPIKRVGEMVVDTLMDILENGLLPARRLVLPTELVIRESCGAIKEKVS